ncbi:unnamed protein product [Schistosoma mattheei]|uniref:Uncharacterized protein n=1 Tax=Schistosoma mattheei TaxID=31246 RepID=A0A183PYE8_9TREM|nr:unnamed protein product [Schistosoma mattheei]
MSITKIIIYPTCNFCTGHSLSTLSIPYIQSMIFLTTNAN